VIPTSPSQRIPLGRSGLSVAPLGWGMWRFAGTDLATARSRVDAALEIGCTLFDTADVYGSGAHGGFGAAETLFGLVLRDDTSIRSRIVLATKAGICPGVPYDSTGPYLLQACEASLRRLGVEQIDLLQIHRPDLLVHPAEVAQAFDTLHRQGKVRAIGVSNYSATQTRALLAHLTVPMASVQPEFSALAIEPLENGVLDLALEVGIGVLAWSPLAGGRLAEPRGDVRADRVVTAFATLAADRGTTPTALAYSWLMAHPARVVPLIGSQSPAHIRAVAAAYAVSWTAPDWYRILVAARGAPMP